MNRVVTVLITTMVLWAAPISAVGDPDVDGGAEGDFLWVGAKDETDDGSSGDVGDGDLTEPAAFVQYMWLSVCADGSPTGSPTAGSECPAAQTCASDSQRRWRLFAKPQSGDWTPLGTQCFGQGDSPPGATPQPIVTPGMVLEAIRRIGLPAVEAKTQPADKTLVNFETIFYAEPQTFSRSLTLLGQRVDVEARPVEYRWHHGDGTVATTTTPGAPYPAKDITYSYADAHATVDTRVDVTYAARFRVNGGPWQDIAETVTMTGPPTPLRIAEAVPVLSGDYS